MPATFPSHQAAVLGLKLWHPRWFDGVALAVGAAAPDVAYLVDGSGLPVWPLSHQWHGLVLWNLPVTLVLCWLFRRASPVVAAHLAAIRDPGQGAWGQRDSGVRGWGLADFGALAGVRHRWWITWSSALLGAGSHILADDVEDLSPVLDPGLSVLGAIVVLLILRDVGRRRLIRQWHGPAPTVTIRPRRFWTTASCVALPGAAIVPVLPAAFLAHTTGARLIAVAALALLCASVVAAKPPSRPSAEPSATAVPR